MDENTKFYKESMFNVDIGEYDGKTLIFNTATRALALFDKEALSRFRESEKNQEIVKKALICAGIDIDDDASLETFIGYSDKIKGEIDNGFIVKANINEMEEYKKRCYEFAHKNSDLLYLTIVPSLACNYRCKYCFEASVLSSSKKMSEDTVNNTIEFVKKYLIDNSCKTLSIEWFGGEPLLQKDIIFKIAPELIKFCEENNITFRSHMVTNGFLLNEELAKRLIKDCRITMVQITLDGLSETYAEIKQCTDIFAFFKVIENIKILEKHHIKVNIRINVSKDNMEEIKELLIYLYEQEDPINSGCCLADVRNYGDAKYATETFYQFKKEIYEWARKNHERIFKHLDLKLPNPRLSSCKATSKEMLTIDYQGRLYQCAHMIDRYGTSGDLINGINEESTERIKALDNVLPDKCYKCSVFPSCLGHCYSDRELEGISVDCDAHIKDLKNTIKLWYEVEKKDFI